MCEKQDKDEQRYAEKYADYVKMLKNTLSKKRFTHSMNVASMCLALAKKHGGDEEKAYLAGLLHDIKKEETIDTELDNVDLDAELNDIDFGNMLDNNMEFDTDALTEEYIPEYDEDINGEENWNDEGDIEELGWEENEGDNAEEMLEENAGEDDSDDLLNDFYNSFE